MSLSALVKKIRSSLSSNIETNQYSDSQIIQWIKESLGIMSELRPRENVIAEITVRPVTILPYDIVSSNINTKNIVNAVIGSLGFDHARVAIDTSFNYHSLEGLSNVRVRQEDNYRRFDFWSPRIIEKQVLIDNAMVNRFCVEVPSDLAVPERSANLCYSAIHQVSDGDIENGIQPINTLSDGLESRVVWLVSAKANRFLATKFSRKEYGTASSTYMATANSLESMALNGIGDRFF